MRALDGAGEPVLVSGSVDASSVTAAINDAGAALVAPRNSAGEVVLVDRAPGGPWAAPARAGRRRHRPARLRLCDSPPIRGSVLAADGRAVVGVERHARRAPQRGGGQRTGRRSLVRPRRAVGDHPRRRSAPASRSTRAASRVLLWSEDSASARAVRGLAPAASDVTPPVVGARLPARIRLAAAGRFRLAVPVRCSEACDVRLSVRGTGDRACAAGRPHRHAPLPRSGRAGPASCVAARARDGFASRLASPTAPATSCASRASCASRPRCGSVDRVVSDGSSPRTRRVRADDVGA